MNDIESTVKAIFNSYAYNRTFSYMIELCEEVNKRVCNYRYVPSDDGNIIYGFLVLIYGDYGTSPRSGWFNGEIAKCISKCISDLSEEYKRLEDEENEED